MKRIYVGMLCGALLLAIVGVVWALEGPHANYNGCGGCHSPHNASGTLLWSRTPGTAGTGMYNLCYSCHDGTVVSKGWDTAMNLVKDQHPVTADSDDNDCDRCHNPHTRKPDGSTNTPYLRAVNGDISDLCVQCHTDQLWNTMASGAGEIGVAGMTHPCVGIGGRTDAVGQVAPEVTPHSSETAPGVPLELTANSNVKCGSCHMVHGAPAFTVDRPILRLTDTWGAGEGHFLCNECHSQ